MTTTGFPRLVCKQWVWCVDSPVFWGHSGFWSLASDAATSLNSLISKFLIICFLHCKSKVSLLASEFRVLCQRRLWRGCWIGGRGQLLLNSGMLSPGGQFSALKKIAVKRMVFSLGTDVYAQNCSLEIFCILKSPAAECWEASKPGHCCLAKCGKNKRGWWEVGWSICV